ncbi:MAG: hypothetical protein HDT29_04730 [Clostridiales bacterium]|nr:hypothetical protein [Clostridiales bacterium]
MKLEWMKDRRYKIIYEPQDTDKIAWCEATYAENEHTLGTAKFFDSDGQIISQLALHIDGYQNEMPVSYDGKKLYTFRTTRLKPYVSCYEMESGALIWANDNKDIREICKIELLDNTLVCEIFELGICLIDADTGELGRWLLRNSGLSMWRITKEHIAIWNCYKMKMYCYDIKNDVLRILSTDFNAKKHFKELVAQGNIPSWNIHFAMNQVKVEDGKLKVRLFISNCGFEASFLEDVPMSEVIGKGEIFVYNPKKKV